MREEEKYKGRRVMGTEVQGKRRRRLDCVRADLRKKGLSGEEVFDRAAWK